MPKKIDLTGRKFGRLTVTREGPPKYTSGGNRKVTWYCDCDCGCKDKTYNSSDLLNGHAKSCGCLNKELTSKRMSERMKSENTYIKKDNYYIGIDSKGNEFWFDEDDFEKVKQYCWYKHRNYFEAKVRSTDKHISLHKLVMDDLENNYDIDHINTDAHYDNRKCNLRIVSRSENNRNKKIQKNNTSGVSGVHYNKTKDVWRATININKKHYQYDFKSFEEAVSKRKEMELKYYGDYSYDSSQKLYFDNKEEN